MNIFYCLTLSLSLGLYAAASQAMEKEVFRQEMPLHTESKASLTYDEVRGLEEKNLKRLNVIKSLMERSAAQLKASNEANEEILPTLNTVNKTLRDYEKALVVMEKAQSTYKSFADMILNAYKKQSSTFGLNFMRYIKLLSCSFELDIISQNAKDSYLNRYISNFYELIIETEQSFTDEEKYWSNFLNIQGPTDIRLSVAQIMHHQVQHMKNINNILDRINLDRFTFNHPSYRALLNKYIEDIQLLNRKLIASLSITRYKFLVQDSRTNLVTSKSFFMPTPCVDNRRAIGITYRNIFDMLNLKFDKGQCLSSEERYVMLSDQQREENSHILSSMLTAATVSPIEKPVHIDNNKNSRRKKPLKAQRKKIQTSSHKPLSRAQKGEEEEVEPQHNEEAEAAQDIQPDIAMAPFIPSGQQQSLQGTSEKEVPLQEEPLPDPLLECKVWLQDIMKKSASQQREYFPIFHKAHSLLKDLENNSELVLLAVQEATCTLAERLNDLANRQESDKKKINNKLVPKNYENDYFLFMETPVTYLHNNIRFGIVRRLVKGLGGEIDDTRSGSRINLTLNKAHTSIHLHDAHNGLLEGGRILSLRKFFIEANLCVNF